MIKIGADYNYYEILNIDLLCSNKILMDKIYLDIKYTRLKEEYNKISFKKKNKKNKKMQSIGMDMNYETIFSNIIKENDDISNDLGDLKEYHCKIIQVFNNIIEKIRMDHLIRPLRIFWIKSDYFLLINILTVISGTIFVFIPYLF